MTIAQQLDQVDQALALLLTQFKSKEAIEQWLASYVVQVQEIEAALFQLYANRAIETAVGVQLDGVGQIVGLLRDGRTDADYRERLRIQILINLSSGTIEDVLGIFDRLLTSVVVMTEYPEAAFMLEVVDPIANGLELVAILEQIKAAAVGTLLVWADSTTGETQWFSFGPNPDLYGQSFGFDNGGFVRAG